MLAIEPVIPTQGLAKKEKNLGPLSCGIGNSS